MNASRCSMDSPILASLPRNFYKCSRMFKTFAELLWFQITLQGLPPTMVFFIYSCILYDLLVRPSESTPKRHNTITPDPSGFLPCKYRDCEMRYVHHAKNKFKSTQANHVFQVTTLSDRKTARQNVHTLKRYVRQNRDSLFHTTTQL